METAGSGGITVADKIAECNWGLASLDLPLAPEHATTAVQSELGVSEVPGAFKYMDVFRQRIRDLQFVEDNGDRFSFFQINR